MIYTYQSLSEALNVSIFLIRKRVEDLKIKGKCISGKHHFSDCQASLISEPFYLPEPTQPINAQRRYTLAANINVMNRLNKDYNPI